MIILPRLTNSETHTFIKGQMTQNAYMDVVLHTKPFIDVCFKNTDKLSYLLNKNSWEWVLNYLKTGENDDYWVNPNKTDILGSDFQCSILNQMIEQGESLCRVPSRTDYEPYINLIIFYPFGKLIFTIKRNEQTVNYLNEIGV